MGYGPGALVVANPRVTRKAAAKELEKKAIKSGSSSDAMIES